MKVEGAFSDWAWRSATQAGEDPAGGDCAVHPAGGAGQRGGWQRPIPHEKTSVRAGEREGISRLAYSIQAHCLSSHLGPADAGAVVSPGWETTRQGGLE